jgi:hypothetical protein
MKDANEVALVKGHADPSMQLWPAYKYGGRRMMMRGDEKKLAHAGALINQSLNGGAE